jgi:ubiquinone/menaquinone biosynthesis C-methylase UbiE
MMNESSYAPDPDLVYSLYTGGFKVQLVRIALLLDVFSPLATGAADAQTIARSCGCDVSQLTALLDYLCSLHLLDRQADTYALTPTAAAFLVPGRQSYAGGWVLADTDPELWNGVLQAMRSGQPYSPEFPYEQDAWLESYRPSRVSQSLEMWQAAGIDARKRPGLRVLDLACGCAIKSFVLAQADPTVHITCQDRAPVLEVARALGDRLRILSQVAFLPGDLFSIDLGKAAYDAALVGQITYSLTPAKNADVVRRVYEALTPGGTLVIDAIMASEPPTEQASLVNVLMRAVSGGAAYPFAQYRRWLEEAGFKQVTQHSEYWLSATR